MSNKTIKINPELFKLGGNIKSSKKQKTIKNKPSIVINPNTIKKQFINKIKEHKNKEILKSSSLISTEGGNPREEEETNTKNDITDEFNESMNYLSNLSKQKKEKKEKEYKIKQLNNVTIKRHDTPLSSNSIPISLELPEEFNVKDNFIPRETNVDLKLKNTQPNDVPYGCLKNGLKPTYRAWCATRKSYGGSKKLSHVPNEDNEPSISIKLREKRLEEIKQKIANRLNTTKENQPQLIQQQSTTHLINDTQYQEKLQQHEEQLQPQEKSQQNETQQQPQQPQQPQQNEPQQLQQKEPQQKEEPIIKTTIKKTYTLGKVNNKVGILLKNITRRKIITDAHRELKNIPINTIKNYLKKRGFIKVGSNAPNDVLRQSYESSVLTGELRNTDKDILLHNIMTDKE
jgi:hypothetical protein